MRLLITYPDGSILSDQDHEPMVARKRMAALLRQERRAAVPVKKIGPRWYTIGPVAFGYPKMIASLIV